MNDKHDWKLKGCWVSWWAHVYQHKATSNFCIEAVELFGVASWCKLSMHWSYGLKRQCCYNQRWVWGKSRKPFNFCKEKLQLGGECAIVIGHVQCAKCTTYSRHAQMLGWWSHVRCAGAALNQVTNHCKFEYVPAKTQRVFKQHYWNHDRLRHACKFKMLT